MNENILFSTRRHFLQVMSDHDRLVAQCTPPVVVGLLLSLDQCRNFIMHNVMCLLTNNAQIRVSTSRAGDDESAAKRDIVARHWVQ